MWDAWGERRRQSPPAPIRPPLSQGAGASPGQPPLTPVIPAQWMTETPYLAPFWLSSTVILAVRPSQTSLMLTSGTLTPVPRTRFSTRACPAPLCNCFVWMLHNKTNTGAQVTWVWFQTLLRMALWVQASPLIPRIHGLHHNIAQS